MPSEGNIISQYRLGRKIGAGGMGEVFLAEDTKLGRRVAIKFLNAERSRDETNLQRFVKEAKTASSLNHPNILIIHEIGDTDDGHYIVSEFVEGETLRDLINSRVLSHAEILNVSIQTASALAAAHAAGIIHRDIKPENIMIRPDGYVKVLDFGLAKLMPNLAGGVEDAATLRQETTEGIIMGTVSYMSPEQTKGSKIDLRTDIFSFGVMLYEMASRRRPFDADSVAETISLILTAEPKPLQAGSPAFEATVRKCLEKDPERRFQTMADLIVALERAKSDGFTADIAPQIDEQETVRLEPLTTQDTHDPPRRFHWRWAIVFTVLALVAAAASYAFYFRAAAPQQNLVSNTGRSPAYDLYVRAKVEINSENREEVDSAINLLEQAVAIDPNYAEANAALARAYYIKAFYYAPNDEKGALMENAEIALEKAFAVKPDLADAHFARGLLLWTHGNRFPHEQTIQAYKRAIALDPNLDEAHHQLGVVYFHLGLLDEGRGEIEKALAINPANTLARFRLGVISLYRGENEEALRYFNGTPLEKHPSLWAFQTATALFQLGRNDEARDLVDKFLRDNPSDEGGVGNSVKAMILAKEGKQEEAEATIQHAIAIGQGFGHFHHTAYNIASAYAILHRPEEAVKWLQIAADDGFPCYPLFEKNPNLNNVRQDPRFIEFMKNLKIGWEKYKLLV
ncbi:MAG: protein kinase [Acidobacteriota bacterium]